MTESLAQEAYVAFVQICKGGSDDAGTYDADEALVRRALKRLDELESAALAEPEPEGPTDQELLEVLDRATADFPPNHPEAEPMTGARYALTLELRKARAILARWGAPPVRTFKPWTEATLF